MTASFPHSIPGWANPFTASLGRCSKSAGKRPIRFSSPRSAPPHAAAARDRPTAADCPGVARRARRPAPTARPRRLGEIPRGYPRAGIAGRLPAPLCYEPLPHLDATGIRATWRRWNTRRRPVCSPRRRLAACCNNRFSAIFMQKAQRIHECVFENRTFSTGC